MSSRNGNGWTYFPDLVIHPDTVRVTAKVAARTLLMEHLRRSWEQGYAAGDSVTLQVLEMDPHSAQAAAYRFGQAQMQFNLDDILTATPEDRHWQRDGEPVGPTSAAVFLCLGTGTSAVEDNRDMVDVLVGA